MVKSIIEHYKSVVCYGGGGGRSSGGRSSSVTSYAKAHYDVSQAYAKRQANQPPAKTSRTTGNSCNFWGGVKSGVEGAAIGGALGALQGSVAPGGGTVAGAVSGAGYGAFSGSMAHTLGCIW